VRKFVREHREKIRIFFLPRHAPQMNPDEQVWNELKHRRLGREPIKNKQDLKRRLLSRVRILEKSTALIQSFFRLPDTKYVNECS
jgi:transposase